MKPAALKKLTASQTARLTEITLLSTRMRERTRDSINISIVQSRLTAINEIWSEARKTHSEIIAQDEARTDNYVTDGIFSRLQTNYEDTLDYLLTLAADFEKESNIACPGSVSVQNATPRPAKLPKLDLPNFSGKYEDWDSFCDLFSALVHNATNVDDCTKLQYLKSCLTGPAADLVKDVTITSANYLSTWQSLRARFYNPRLTVSNHLNALMNLPPLKRESASEMRAFADECQRIVRALKNLKMPVESWDVWIIHILSARLDTESRKLWESELSAKDRAVNDTLPNGAIDSEPMRRFPTFDELSSFLEKRAHALGMICAEIKIDRKIQPFHKSLPSSRKVLHTSASRPQRGSASKCPLCPALHALAKCPTFLAKTPYERRADVRHLRLCYNCFGRHNCRDCTSNGRCNKCRDKHHSLLHFDAKKRVQSIAPPLEGNSREQKVEGSGSVTGMNIHTITVPPSKCVIILATAEIILEGLNGNCTRARALLDQGSEGSFVSEATAQLLGLPRQRINVPLTGVGGSAAGTARSKTTFKIRSRLAPEFALETEALVLQRLTSQLPERMPIELNLENFKQINLADPQFFVPNSVDVILGADVYGLLLRPGLQRLPCSQIVAQNTALGWIISGSTQSGQLRRAEQNNPVKLKTLHTIAKTDSLYDALERFWILDDIPHSRRKLKPEDEACEKQYSETHTRAENGRYTVCLPTKFDIPEVAAETRKIALGSLRHMHGRFERNAALASSYREFMSDYEQLGHMSRIPNHDLSNPRAWYLPHHAVMHNDKIRVVFDASRKTHDHYSLNDFLLSGPPLQGDLGLILLNWRRYRFVFTADIVKMFRQILIAPADRDLQRILWAPSSSDPPVEYCLNTVTYGTNCAPFLALRTLAQLARDGRDRFPLGARCLDDNTYVDDMFVGADEISRTIHKREQLIELLKSAGFHLDKWAANDPKILPSFVRRNIAASPKAIDRDGTIKTLGVDWNPVDDTFAFSTSGMNIRSESLTKRNVLSDIARLFDPLGWLAPVSIIAKVLMQDLWIQKCEWDAPLPVDIRERWIDYCQSLSALPSLSVDRWLGIYGDRAYQLHGFSDASSRAYAAAVYLRIEETDGTIKACLLAAKTKVAPVKTISVPNLELCGAGLLTKLVCHLKSLKFIKNLPIFMWSDSQIVLKWLDKHPSHWKTFVANRVSHIQTELPAATWAHVPTKQNPADIATRGARPNELRESSLWWHGPAWLSLPPEKWLQQSKPMQTMHARVELTEHELLTRFSSLTRLIRVTAYCVRPLHKLRRAKNNLSPLPPFLTSAELSEARKKLIRLAQAQAFATELKLLKAGKSLLKGSSIIKLNPVLNDSDGILRVGGRLSQATVEFDRKHPPILPRESSLSRLMVRHAHMLALHGGPTLTSNTLMRQAWILGRNQLVKSVIRNCIKCQRVKPRLAHQIMGDLPANRVTPARPFTTSGVDYAGPFHIRASKGRGQRAYKGYIALFVCFATRAVHLELVSDLTTASFLLAYRRFVSRRGICRHLYSDHSTTFRGADRELRCMFDAASDFYKNIASTIANDGTAWTFIPPTTPHYGGIWEAGVKSTKHHLKRAFGEHLLTFEEFSTVIAEIEACLNSRPLCPLTSDIDDLSVLTPAHFLFGETPGAVPDQEPPNAPENRLSRYQLMQRISSQFWRSWSSDYLQHLQERGKWRSATENFSIGDLVVLRDDRYPPAKWPLGRIIETHPGPDGYVRVVTVKTATTTSRRHIARLSPLYINSDKTGSNA